MNDRRTEVATLRDLLQVQMRDPDASAELALAAFLVAGSQLPGPRANLSLAKTFADQVAELGTSDAMLALLRRWLAIPAAEAPTGNPHEFLPFCALQALGAFYIKADESRRAEIVELLRNGASDERWRVREAAAIALQRIGLANFGAFQAIVGDWLPSATLLEQRAILAALAEPPLLRAPGAADYALAVADKLLETVRGLDAAARKCDDFRVLRQALEYGISVIVAASPRDGFARMRAWAAVDDRDIARILRANLGKARLRKNHEVEVQRLLAEL
jgi:hypothetical protein